jgi:hypothetical protein
MSANKTEKDLTVFSIVIAGFFIASCFCPIIIPVEIALLFVFGAFFVVYKSTSWLFKSIGYESGTHVRPFFAKLRFGFLSLMIICSIIDALSR